MKVELIGMMQGVGPYDCMSGEVLCGMAAATCTNGTHYSRSLKAAVNSGHDSVMENAVYMFRITGVSRVLLAQLTRHRLASFGVESQRYVEQSEAEVVIPPSIANNPRAAEHFKSVVEHCREAYETLMEMGIEGQDARYILPMGIETKLTMTMNARELNHFFTLRMCNRAQWEIREMADQMFRLVYKTAPVIFKDAGPGCCRGCCPEKKPCKKSRRDEIAEMKQKHNEG